MSLKPVGQKTNEEQSGASTVGQTDNLIPSQNVLKVPEKPANELVFSEMDSIGTSAAPNNDCVQKNGKARRIVVLTSHGKK